MTHIYRLLFAAALALPLLATISPADAAQINVCRSAPAGGTAGPGQWTAISGTKYSLNNGGCTLVAPADLASAQAAGFILRSSLYSVVMSATTASGSVVLPPGTFIDRVIAQETSGAAIGAGILVGTTSGGSDIINGMTCAANCLVTATDASMLKRVFSATAAQNVFIGVPTPASQLTVTVVYGYF